jgi:hypothetical protein
MRAALIRRSMVLCMATTLLVCGSASAAGTTWTSHGPQGADIEAFTVDPGSGVIYAGGGQSVWSSSDGGTNWTKAGSTQSSVTWLGADPSGSVMYASNDFSSCPFERSTDGGATWTRVCAGSSGSGEVAIDEVSGDLFAEFSGSAFTSTDQGQSWTSTGTGPASVTSLAVAHGSPDQLYVGTYDGHVWRSDDAGATFSDLGQVGTNPIRQVVVAPDGVYAVSIESSVMRSTDQGQTWAEADGGHGSAAFSLVAGTTPGTLYLVGSLHDYVTTDGGSTWSGADTGLYFPGSGLAQPLWIDPSNQSHLLASNGRDIYSSADGGASWSFSSAGLSANQEVTALAVDASGPSTLYAGTHDGGVFVSTNEGVSWAPAGNGLYGGIFAMAADPSTPGTLYVSNGGHVYKSTDGAASWTQIDSGFPANSVIWAVTVDPTDPQRVYAAAGSTIERSTDGGATWTAATTSPVQPSGYSISGLVVDRSDPSRLYASGTKVWVSSDHGDTWSSSMSSFPGSDYAQSIAQDSGNPSHLLVGGFDHSYSSTDGGSTWTAQPIAGGAVAYDPGGNGTEYVATDLGVEVSPDGATWGLIDGSDTAARFGKGVAFDGSRLIVASGNGVTEANLVTPSVTTLAPLGYGSRSATIRATVNPEGLGTTVVFQYGTTTAYGQSTYPVTAGDGSDDVTITDLVQGFLPATTYHYRAVVLGNGGVAVGADQTFTTYGDQPDVVTGSADAIAADQADLHGTVNPNGLATSVAFDIGTSPGALVRYDIGTAGSGTAVLPEDLTVYDLQPDTTYQYRIRASNIQDPSLGAIETFRTAPAPPRMAGPPLVDLPIHQVVESTDMLLQLSWESEPGSHPICSHLVEYSEDGQPFSVLPMGTLPGSATYIGVTPGHSDVYGVAAVGCDSTQSAWAYSTAVRTALVSQSKASAGSGWSTTDSKLDLGGSQLRSNSPTARAAFTTDGYVAGWVATKGRSYGRALVSSDGGATWSTVNLHAKNAHHRVLVYAAHWPTSGRHTILIHALPTNGRPLLSIDGFVVLH